MRITGGSNYNKTEYEQLKIKMYKMNLSSESYDYENRFLNSLNTFKNLLNIIF